MNKDDVIRWAREAGIVFDDKAAPFYERFAALIAAAEREKCAKYLDSCEDGVWANTCAYAIRAMGKK